MLLLCLDTATAAVAVGLVELTGDGCEVLAEQAEVDARRHGELLAPAVRSVLCAAGRTVGALEAIVAGLGPGPFTSLRVGIVTAASMAQALGVPCYGACSLDALAEQAGTGDAGVGVATDARRREVYWAGYDAAGRRVDGPGVGAPADVAARFAGRRVVGAGAQLYRDAFDAAGAMVTPPLHVRATALAPAAAKRVLARGPGERLEPLYLRRPDAAIPGERR